MVFMLGEKVDRLFQLRAEKAELEQQVKELTAEIEQLQYEILRGMEETGVDKLSTASGTVSRKVELHPQIVDWDVFVDWVYSTGNLSMIQRRVNSGAFRSFVEETNEYPEGLDAYQKPILNVRKK